jgi:hypothetical protein
VTTTPRQRRAVGATRHARLRRRPGTAPTRSQRSCGRASPTAPPPPGVRSLSWTCATSRCSTSTAPTELSSARCGRGCAPTPPPTSRWPVRSTAAAPSPTRHDKQARLRPFYMIHTCYPTGAGDDHGIDPNKKWLRLPYVSTFLRSRCLHPHPYSRSSSESSYRWMALADPPG